MNLVGLLFETVDFFEECQEKISCNFSNFLSDNRSKLLKFSIDCTMARLDFDFAKNNAIKSEVNFRNIFFQKITKEFDFVHKNVFFDVTDLGKMEDDFNNESKFVFCLRKGNPFLIKIK